MDASCIAPGRLALLLLLKRGAATRAAHIHVKGGGRDAKIWLEPGISIADSYGFNPRELSNILRVVEDNRELLLKAWHDHFGN
ncbi:DUF4160 domain-containing protein [Bradyrhizobium canariense]|uniref:DUF4160 domain-containing protein n=1 Tax=Bradyrhizobium canariense TaxID=255045 RepID=UPI00308364D8